MERAVEAVKDSLLPSIFLKKTAETSKNDISVTYIAGSALESFLHSSSLEWKSLKLVDINAKYGPTTDQSKPDVVCVSKLVI